MDITRAMLEGWMDRIGTARGLLKRFPNGTTLEELYDAVGPGADPSGYLRIALFAMSLDAAKELVDNGIDVNVKSRNSFTPLMAVAKAGDAETAEWLILHGAEVSPATWRGPAALRVAVAEDNRAVADVLMACGVAPDLFCAAGLGLTDRVAELLKLEDEEGVQGGWLIAPLRAAARSGHVEVVKMLLAAGAEVDAKGEVGMTALHEAVDAGRVGAARALLDAGADVDLQDEVQRAPLHIAAEQGDEEMTKLLLGAFAAPNARNFSGATPLHVAMFFGNLRVAEMLVEAGANPAARDDQGQTPVDHAAISPHAQTPRPGAPHSGTQEGIG